MKSRKPRRSKGRPLSASDGAADAFDAIEQFRAANSLTKNALALRYKMTPSTVSRALGSRSAARWTPTLKQLYRIAKNEAPVARVTPAMARLASYEGPGNMVVRRLLGDVEDLITSLSPLRR